MRHVGFRGVTAVAALGLGAAHCPAASIFIDFGEDGSLTSGAGWNNVVASSQNGGGTNLYTLTDTDGNTNVTMQVHNPPSVAYQGGFNTGGNGNGVGGSGGPAAPVVGSALALKNYPVSATRDSLYGNTTAENPWQGLHVPAVRLTLTNLDPSTPYTFDFFGSRADGGNRVTRYTVAGAGSPVSENLKISSNASDLATIASIFPDAQGTVIIDLTRVDGTDNQFFYLNVLEITAVPEPAALSLLGLGGLGLLRRKRRL